jgi:hypothetical protein
MAAFTSAEVSVATATPVKVADSDDFARRVYTSDNTAAFRLAFSSGTASTGAFVSKLSGFNSGAVDFLLPAGQELWVFQASGSTQTINVLVTTDGEV